MLPKCSPVLFQPFFIFLTTFVIIAPTARPLSFDFNTLPKINGSPCGGDGSVVICLQGDASMASPEVIELTTNKNHSVGRAYYSQPIHLWDKTTGQLANFNSSFSIKMNPQKGPLGDGMAFFLSPYPYTAPPQSEGGYLGVASRTNLTQFVAVEFDSFANVDASSGKWDPDSIHIGIDIGSIKSATTTELFPSSYVGHIGGNATVSYDALSRNFSVHFIDDFGPMCAASYVVDLRDKMPEWVVVGFSASIGFNHELHSVSSWKFESTLVDMLSVISAPAPAPIPSNAAPKEKRSRLGLIVAVAVTVVVVITVAISFGLWRRQTARIDPERDTDGDKDAEGDTDRGVSAVNDLAHATYNFLETIGVPSEIVDAANSILETVDLPGVISNCEELVDATNNFLETVDVGEVADATNNLLEIVGVARALSDEELGPVGMVYKGRLPDCSYVVAIKKSHISDKDKEAVERGCIADTQIINKLQHQNLVRPFGWCNTPSEILLVYELMESESLDKHLFDSNQLLSWPVRYKIAKGLAYALQHLHADELQCVIHKDIRSSNVLLDRDFNAVLGDIGISRQINHESSMETSVVHGTVGYMAPELVVEGATHSKSTDVYSFGVVLLEIASGMRPYQAAIGQKMPLLPWIWSLYGSNELLQALDPRLKGDFDEKEMERVMIVGLWCANPNSSDRPSMEQAIAVLQFEADMPTLPTKMPPSLNFLPITPVTNTEGEQSREVLPNSTRESNSGFTSSIVEFNIADSLSFNIA